jgi:hypothetical protein
VREEEDELLRAAEELGIDLSPGSLRVAPREPTAEEIEEGQERIDETGELTVPADEALGDIDEGAVDLGEDAIEPLDADFADVEAEE